jgi:preprotein translocase subunit YajC
VEFLPLIGIALLFWVLLIRPQSKRQRELRGMQESLSVGDEVVLTSGIYGTVREVDGLDLRVEVADGVTVRVARGAIGAIKRPDTETDTDTANTNDVPELGEEGNK